MVVPSSGPRTSTKSCADGATVAVGVAVTTGAGALRGVTLGVCVGTSVGVGFAGELSGGTGVGVDGGVGVADGARSGEGVAVGVFVAVRAGRGFRLSAGVAVGDAVAAGVGAAGVGRSISSMQATNATTARGTMARKSLDLLRKPEPCESRISSVYVRGRYASVTILSANRQACQEGGVVV